MLKKREVDAEEERLRKAVNDLDDERRQAFYRDVRHRVRDPDTYAALNWFFIAGLHHFYLGRWQLGLADLAIFLGGVALILQGHLLPGVLAVVAISLWELWALFRAQVIVQDWNNRIYRQCLRLHGGQ